MFDTINILIPVFNNAETLRDLVDQVQRETASAARTVDFVFVDDASGDRSGEVLRALAGPNIAVIFNSENIGQQASIQKGLAVCDAQAVVVMDADLQDPPEAIPELLRALSTGTYDAVFATRVGQYQSGRRMFSARAFRFLIRQFTNLPYGAGGFVTFTRHVAQGLTKRPHARFYLAGLIGCGGYRIGSVPVERNERAIGKSAYSGSMRLALGLSNLSAVIRERTRRER